MALAVQELEQTLVAARAAASGVRLEARAFKLPTRAAMTVAAGAVVFLVGMALLILILAGKDGNLSDPALAKLVSAPEDDEPLSDQEEAQLAEAKAELARGETEPWDRLRDELKAG